jgi:mycofactocin precursor
MDDIASPADTLDLAQETAVIEDAPPAPASDAPAALGDVEVVGEEEPFEEFVIEDFTIDGICGVY